MTLNNIYIYILIINKYIIINPWANNEAYEQLPAANNGSTDLSPPIISPPPSQPFPNPNPPPFSPFSPCPPPLLSIPRFSPPPPPLHLLFVAILLILVSLQHRRHRLWTSLQHFAPENPGFVSSYRFAFLCLIWSFMFSRVCVFSDDGTHAIFYFTASWCRPCKGLPFDFLCLIVGLVMMWIWFQRFHLYVIIYAGRFLSPKLEEMSREFPNVQVFKVDIDLVRRKTLLILH